MATSTTAIAQNTAYPAAAAPGLVRESARLRFSRLRNIEAALDLVTGFGVIELACRISSLSGSHVGFPKHIHLAVLFLSVTLTALLARAGAYRIGGGLLGIRETACVVEAVFGVLLILFSCALVAGRYELLEPGLVTITLLGLLLVLQRKMYSGFLMRTRSSRCDIRRVAIYGQDQNAMRLLETILRSPRSNFLPVACFNEAHTEGDEKPFVRKFAPVKIYNTDRFSEEFLCAAKVDLVVIASPMSSAETLKRVLKHSESAGARVLFGAEEYTLESVGIEYVELDGHLLYGSHTATQRVLYNFVKRSFDIVLAAIVVVFASLPMLLVAVAIALDTRGPILFKQIRIGLHGRPFTIFKFRTMHTDMCGYKVSPRDSSDPRITRVGRWLRKTSLDELPQLFNILRGEMTLVGPRPEMPFIVGKYSKTEMQRLAAKPGLTGIWQISEDRRYPIHENIHYDLYYLKHRSTSVDLALMLHTVLLAVKGV